MGVFHVFKILQMVPNPATYHIYFRSIENNAAKVAQLKSSSLNKVKQNQSLTASGTPKTASNLQHGASHTSHSHSNINTPSQSNLNSPSKHITASPSKFSTTSPNKRTTTSPNKPTTTSPNKPSSLSQPNIEVKLSKYLYVMFFFFFFFFFKFEVQHRLSGGYHVLITH